MSSFQKYLQKEANINKGKLKQSQNLKIDENKDEYEDRPVKNSPRNFKPRTSQSFGEKVQRFNKALVPDQQQEQMYDQAAEKNYPPNFGYEQTIPQIYQSQNMMAGVGPQTRYNQPENMYGQQNMQGEKELAGYSEQIMSTPNMSPYMGSNQPYFNASMGSASLENMKLYNGVDPKASLYNPNMASMNMPHMMVPGQMQPNQQMFGVNTFGNDPNMSMYGQRPGDFGNMTQQDPFNDPYNLTVNKQDNDFLNEKLQKVQQMYDTLKKEYDEQKKFYDEALEARTNQLEEAENEANKLKSEIELTRKGEVELKSKNESLKFDNEMLNKRIETTSQDKSNASQREEGLLKQLDELNTALKQKESIIEQKVDENFGLKQKIDSMRNEAEKTKKRLETLEDVLRNKDQEITDYDRELDSTKSEVQSLSNKEHNLLRDMEGMKNENTQISKQLRSEKDKYSQIYNEFNRVNDALNQ